MIFISPNEMFINKFNSINSLNFLLIISNKEML